MGVECGRCHESRVTTHPGHVGRVEVHGVQPVLQVRERGGQHAPRQRRVLRLREVAQHRPHGVGGRLQLARERRVVRRRLELDVPPGLADVHVHACGGEGAGRQTKVGHDHDTAYALVTLLVHGSSLYKAYVIVVQ